MNRLESLRQRLATPWALVLLVMVLLVLILSASLAWRTAARTAYANAVQLGEQWRALNVGTKPQSETPSGPNPGEHVLSGVLLGACLLQMPWASAQAPAAGRASPASPVTLNFIDAEIESVVRAVGQFMGRPFLVDPRVQGKITAVSDRPVSAS